MEYLQLIDMWATTLVKIITGNPILLGCFLLWLLGNVLPKLPNWVRNLRIRMQTEWGQRPLQRALSLYLPPGPEQGADQAEGNQQDQEMEQDGKERLPQQ